MNMDIIAQYRKLHDKVEALWEVYGLEDSETLSTVYLSHIHEAYEELDKLVSSMTAEEVIYISLKEGWNNG